MATRENIAPAVAHSEVPAMIAGSVNLMRFSEALARAGIVGRYDADRGVLVIEPAGPARPAIPAEAGMRWYNGLSKAERTHWHRIAGSAVAADAWGAWKAAQRCHECGGTGLDDDAGCDFCGATGREGRAAG